MSFSRGVTKGIKGIVDVCTACIAYTLFPTAKTNHYCEHLMMLLKRLREQVH